MNNLGSKILISRDCENEEKAVILQPNWKRMSILRSILIAIGMVSSVNMMAEEADTLATTRMNEVEIVSTLKENGQTRLQPGSVSQINQRMMRDNHITSLKQTSSLVPNLFIPDYGSRLTSAIYIRGIGSRINTPAVGLYVDDIPYLDKSAYDFNFYDIERLDVLRGPQGTMYGRNTMGGLVRVYTKNPFYNEGTDVRLSYATSDNHRTASLTHYHRVNDQFAFSAGGYWDGCSGFFENDLTGKRCDAMESGGGRMRGIYKPNDRLTLDATLSYDYTDEGAYPYYYTGATDGDEQYADLIGTVSNNRESSYRRSLLNAGVNLTYQRENWKMQSITGYQHLKDRMFMDQDFIAEDIYTLEQKQRIHSLTEELLFRNTGNEQWQSVSGLSLMYQSLNTQGPVVFYEDGLRWLEGNINTMMPQIGQIPMLSMMGFQHMALNFRGDKLLMDGTYETPTAGAAIFHQSTWKITDRFSATGGLRLDYEHQQMRYNSPANVNYGFTMYNQANEKMEVNLQELESHISYEGSLKNDRLRLLPKLSLKYEIDELNNLYTSVGMGQRSGGYNLQMFSDLIQGAMRVDMMNGIKTGVGNYLDYLVTNNSNIPKAIPDPDNSGQMIALPDFVRRVMEQNMPQFETPTVNQVVYKPEYSINYELGTHLTLAEQTVKVDATVFYNRIYNQQIARFAQSGLGRMMVNAGESQSCGGEISLRYQPNKHLQLLGNYGYTHATFLKYDNGNGEDYTGKYVPYVPMHTMNADAAYSWDIGNHVLTLGVGCNGAGRIYWMESNAASEPFNAQLNARLSLQTRHFTASLWCRNIADAKYSTFYFESASRGYEQHCKPRQFGIDMNIHF